MIIPSRCWFLIAKLSCYSASSYFTFSHFRFPMILKENESALIQSICKADWNMLKNSGKIFTFQDFLKQHIYHALKNFIYKLFEFFLVSFIYDISKPISVWMSTIFIVENIFIYFKMNSCKFKDLWYYQSIELRYLSNFKIFSLHYFLMTNKDLKDVFIIGVDEW